MTSIHPTIPRLVVRDSFDDEDLTDIDDVFIRDGKRGLKTNTDRAAKRPLMAPRRKSKITVKLSSTAITYQSLLLPLCYGLTALGVLFALMLLCVLTINIFPIPISMIRTWFSVKSKPVMNITDILPCTSLISRVVWTRTLPKLTSEAPLRSVDINNDGVEDIILGFSTGLDALNAPEFLCNLYFNGQVPCLGGIMALNGRSGETLWIHWTEHTIFSIDCTLDLTNDKIKDCIITGRGGILQAINSSNGLTLWELPIEALPSSLVNQEVVLNVYDARFIPDIDGDKIGDVIVSHTMQLGNMLQSRVILLSGKTGSNIKAIEFSKKEQLFIAPQMLVSPDGEIAYLLSSCAPDKSGSLYVVSQRDFLYGNLDNMKKIQHGEGEGVLLPPILVDLTLDGTEDIIVISLNNSTIRAYDGLSYQQLWNYTVRNSEIISVPIPGYYNDDEVPDIMIKHQVGPGFPVYYYSLTTILDGKTGKSIFDEPIKDIANGQMSGLTLSVDGFGNDWFLHWSANCLDHQNIDEKYHFLHDQKTLLENRADLCKSKFNSTFVMKFLAMSQYVGPPGQPVYSSDEWKTVEMNDSIQLTGTKNMEITYSKKIQSPTVDTPLVAQRSPRIENLQMDVENFNTNQNNRIIMDEGGDYFIPKKNEKNRNSERDNDMPYVRSFEKKIENDYPIEQDWKNINSWSNIPLEKPYEMSDVDGSRPELPQKDETLFDSENKFNFLSDENEKKIIDENNLNLFHQSLRKKRLSNSRHKRNKNNDVDRSIQRQPPTGILRPSFSNSKKNIHDSRKTVDLIFSTYWLPPSEVSLIVLQKDLDCVRLKEKKYVDTMEPNQRENIVRECLSERSINNKHFKEKLDQQENIKFPLGQMTVYRMELECICPDDMMPGQSCKNITYQQSWSEHMGSTGNGYFRPRSKKN